MAAASSSPSPSAAREKKRRGSLWRNRAAYLVFTGVSALLFLLLRSNETKIMFFTLVFLPVISYILAWLVRRRVKVTQRLDCLSVEKGQPAKFTVLLENGGRVPAPYIHFCFADDAPGLAYPAEPGLYSLPPRGRRELQFSVTARYRGSYAVGASEVFVEDFLRIFRLRCEEPARSEILVYPSVEPLRFFSQTTAVADHMAPRPGAVEDYSSVAEIVPYDPSREFRKIHWKLTARLDELMVRQFETEDTARAALLLDLSGLGEGAQGAAEADALAEGAVSILAEWMKEDRPAMFAYGTDKPSVLQRAGSEGFEAFCQLIAGLPCTSPYDAAQLLSYYIEDRHPGTVAAVLTGRADDPLLSAVDHARAEGVQVSVFYLERKAAPSDEAALEALEREGVPVVRFSVQERLHTALDGRRI